jgi:hypothetical protein
MMRAALIDAVKRLPFIRIVFHQADEINRIRADFLQLRGEHAQLRAEHGLLSTATTHLRAEHDLLRSEHAAYIDQLRANIQEIRAAVTENTSSVSQYTIDAGIKSDAMRSDIEQVTGLYESLAARLLTLDPAAGSDRLRDIKVRRCAEGRPGPG